MYAATARSHRAGRHPWILPSVLAGLLLLFAPASGVRALSPERGDTIRLATADDRQPHSLQELAERELGLEGEDQLSPLPLELSDSQNASTERQRRVFWAGVVGLAVGAGVGAVAGPELFRTDCEPDNRFDWSCFTEGEARTLGAIIGGVVGAGLGIFIAMSGSAAIPAPVASSTIDVWAHASLAGFGLQLSWRL